MLRKVTEGPASSSRAAGSAQRDEPRAPTARNTNEVFELRAQPAPSKPAGGPSRQEAPARRRWKEDPEAPAQHPNSNPDPDPDPDPNPNPNPNPNQARDAATCRGL